MDRNSIIGLIIIVLILIIYGVVNQPSKEEIQEQQRIQDSLRRARQEQVEKEKQQEEEKEKREAIVSRDQREKKEQQAGRSEKESADSLNKSRFGSFASAASGDKKIIILENDRVKAKIATKGGRPWSVELKEYQTYDKEPLVLFGSEDDVFGFNFYADNRAISTNEMYFVQTGDRDSLYAKNSVQTVALRLKAGKDRYIEYEYSLAPGSYKMDFNIRFVGMNQIIPNNYRVLDLKWDTKTYHLEKGRKNENDYTTIAYKHYQDEVDKMRARGKDDATESISTKVKWVSFKQQFFSSILVADGHFTNSELEYKKIEDSEEYLKNLTAEIGIPYENDYEYEVPLSFYFLPNHYKTLKQFDKEFEEMIPLGWALFGWVNKYIVIPIFNWLDNSIANYGIIILLLTLIIKLALFPLTYRSYMSQAKMRVLKPEIDEINKKYPKKEDSMKKQRATMDLYKKAGVNPLGGCLPLLLQFPFLLAMVRFFPSSFELRQESFLWAEDLSTYDSIAQIPDIPLYGDHISLFTLLMAVTLFFSTRINSSQMNTSNAQMPGMKFFTTYFMPVMLLFIFNRFPAALSYYFFLSNGITLAQTLIIRRFVDDEKIHKKIKENKKKPAKKSKWQQRLEEAAKQKGYQPSKKKK